MEHVPDILENMTAVCLCLVFNHLVTTCSCLVLSIHTLRWKDSCLCSVFLFLISVQGIEVCKLTITYNEFRHIMNTIYTAILYGETVF